MISLGIGELVAASALMLPGFFGGEAGISGNRVNGAGWFDIDFGPQLQMYYLIAAWTLASGLAMYGLTCTPLGRIANAVRDNPERVQFIGYDTHRVRFYQLLWSAFFAGIAGTLAALNFELVTAENVSANASGAILVMTYIGGTGQFFGPVLGAAFVTFLSTVLSNYTKAWPFYYGLLFLLTILFVPGGLSSLIALHAPAWRARLITLLIPSYLLAAATAAVLGSAAILLIEMCYHLSETPDAPAMTLFGFGFDVTSYTPWLTAIVLLLAGLGLLAIARTAVGRAWQQVQLRSAPPVTLTRQQQRQGATV
jgi:branched-chain amino acid transport system permease protein